MLAPANVGLRLCHRHIAIAGVGRIASLAEASDTLAERLRRRPAKPMGSPRVGSNPTGVVCCLAQVSTSVGNPTKPSRGASKHARTHAHMCVPTHALPRDLGKQRARCVCSEFQARPVVKFSVSQSSLGAFPDYYLAADFQSAALAFAYCAQSSMQQLVQSCLCAAVHSGQEHHKRSRRQPLFCRFICRHFVLLFHSFVGGCVIVADPTPSELVCKAVAEP